MTVAEVKALAPLAEVYELRADVKYLFVFPYDIADSQMKNFIGAGRKMHLQGTIVQMPRPSDLRIIDMEKA